MFCHNFSLNYQLSSRRGISQIFGSLMLLAIVVPIGSVILINGTSEINAFNNELTSSGNLNNISVQEDLVFEHIRFNPSDEGVELWIRNTGTIETTVDRITILNMSDQTLIYKISGLGTWDKNIPLKENVVITFQADLKHNRWDHSDPDDNPDHQYKVSLITKHGTFFDTVARKYNT